LFTVTLHLLSAANARKASGSNNTRIAIFLIKTEATKMLFLKQTHPFTPFIFIYVLRLTTF